MTEQWNIGTFERPDAPAWGRFGASREFDLFGPVGVGATPEEAVSDLLRRIASQAQKDEDRG